MSKENAVVVSNVSKRFKIPLDKSSGIKQHIVNFFKRKRGYREFTALNDVSFEIKKGDFFGIVGRNGSGKSTLLKTIAQIYNADRGGVTVNGSLVPFIELGVGFNPELTGRENVFLNGALLGFSKEEMESMYEEIVDFAELHDFMEEKLKNYSSGMQVRLAFSIAIRARGDILLLDEVLAVGDTAFQKKCYNYFMHLKRNKKTVILVTHDMGAIRQYCDRAVMINKGKVVGVDTPDNIAQMYQRLFNGPSVDSDIQEMTSQKRWGTGRLKETKTIILQKTKTIEIESEFVAIEKVESPVFGLTIMGPGGASILESNTQKVRYNTSILNKGERVTIGWSIPNLFANGKHTVNVACCDKSLTEFYDWNNQAASFDISKETSTGSLIDPVLKVIRFKKG